MKTILHYLSLGIYSPYRNPAAVMGWTACWRLPLIGWIAFTHTDGHTFWRITKKNGQWAIR